MLMLPQMILGKPKISIGIGSNTTEDYTILNCVIKNEPIKNKHLKRLGVRRATADLVAHFKIYTIREDGKGILVSEENPCLWVTYGKDEAKHISLPASPVPASFAVTTYFQQTNEVRANDEGIVLSPGHYYVRIWVTVDGEDIRKAYNFNVTAKHPFITWA